MKKHRLTAAVLALGLAASGMSFHAAAAGTRVSVHDPSIIKDGGTYYVFGSHIDAAKSTDLINWKTFTNGYARTNNIEFGNLSENLAKAFAWAGEDLEDCKGGFAVWAPDVIWNPDYVNPDGSKGAYVMYFCTSSTYMCSVICYATAQNVEGPYTFVDTLIYSGFTDTSVFATSPTKNVNRRYSTTNIDELLDAGEITWQDNWFNGHAYNNYLYPNAIDPTIYYGTDGKMYMTYGSWSGGIFTLEIDPATGRCIHPKTGTTSDGRMVDSYFGTKIAGGYYKSGEGPFIDYNAETGYYYLWTTYGGLLSDGGYNMRVSRSTSPTGPFYDAAGNPAVLGERTDLDSVGLKVMGNYKFSSLDRAYMACGHNSVLRDDDGQWYLFNHARFDDGTEYHEVRVRAMYFNEEGWPVVTPFEFSGDKMVAFGYEPADIVGEYEYINHGNATDGVIIDSVRIDLNADGTISGGAKGTWEQAADSSAATLVIGGKTYSGYFTAARNESGKKVMSFTAVGSNNQTVWGVKNDAFTGTERAGGNADYTNSKSKLVYNPETASGTGTQVNIGDTSLLSGVSYCITNVNSSLALDLKNGSTADGANIQQWEKNGEFAQEWRIIAEDDGYCRIVSLGDEGKCIAVAEASAEDGVNIELQAYSGADNQLWKLVRIGIHYGIVSKCSGDTAGLDVFEWSEESGGNINQWNFWGGECQLWNITPVHPFVNNGSYTIRNAESGQYITSGSESPEAWTFTKQADGTYTIVNAAGQSLDAAGSYTIRCGRDGSYTLSEDGQHYVFEPVVPEQTPEKIRGDVDADGKFTLADVVMMQKYILGVGMLNDYEMGEICEDGTLDVFDLVLMKRMLLQK